MATLRSWCSPLPTLASHGRRSKVWGEIKVLCRLVPRPFCLFSGVGAKFVTAFREPVLFWCLSWLLCLVRLLRVRGRWLVSVRVCGRCVVRSVLSRRLFLGCRRLVWCRGRLAAALFCSLVLGLRSAVCGVSRLAFGRRSSRSRFRFWRSGFFGSSAFFCCVESLRSVGSGRLCTKRYRCATHVSLWCYVRASSSILARSTVLPPTLGALTPHKEREERRRREEKRREERRKAHVNKSQGFLLGLSKL